MIDKYKWLLYLHPRRPPSACPVIDSITRKMCAAFREGMVIRTWGGCHECYCGALSSCHDYRLPSRHITNSLCVHYLAHHRAEVSPQALALVDGFDSGEAEPTPEELFGPDRAFARARNIVVNNLGRERLEILVEWGLDTQALMEGLRGGKRCGTTTFVRQQAESLFDLLYELKPLETVERFLVREHGDVRAWATQAFRLPDWKCEAWLPVLLMLIDRPYGDPWLRDMAAHCFRLIGPVAGTAVPTLFEMIQHAPSDHFRRIQLILDDLAEMSDVEMPSESISVLTNVATSTNSPTSLRMTAARFLGYRDLALEFVVPFFLELALSKSSHADIAASDLCGEHNMPPFRWHRTGVGCSELAPRGIRGWQEIGEPRLREALNDPDESVSRKARAFLLHLGLEVGQPWGRSRKRVPCRNCGAKIMPSTAWYNHGLCGKCHRAAEEKRGDEERKKLMPGNCTPDDPRHISPTFFTKSEFLAALAARTTRADDDLLLAAHEFREVCQEILFQNDSFGAGLKRIPRPYRELGALYQAWGMIECEEFGLYLRLTDPSFDEEAERGLTFFDQRRLCGLLAEAREACRDSNGPSEELQQSLRARFCQPLGNLETEIVGEFLVNQFKSERKARQQ